MLRGIEQYGAITGYCQFDASLVFENSGKRALVPESAKTIICALFPYYVGELRNRNVARYACVDDYHKICGEMLEAQATALKGEYQNEDFVWFIDVSPVREVAAACACGLGVVGINQLLINGAFGSNVFIGEMITTLALVPAKTEERACLQCGSCVKACPTGALSFGGPFKKERCRSFITQKKGKLTGFERDEIKAGGFVWGCDICADACPMNKTRVTGINGFLGNISPVVSRGNLDDIIESKPYNWRGRDVILRNLEILGE